MPEGVGIKQCAKSRLPAAWINFELHHTLLKLLKSAVFAAVIAFFFPPDLSKMHMRTFNKQKTNK
ncbi:hypothetical protein BZP36_14185 [Raoultella terrigena]|nr:hypothetical protein BZP36_14185 [Raoultella terrigena]